MGTRESAMQGEATGLKRAASTEPEARALKRAASTEPEAGAPKRAVSGAPACQAEPKALGKVMLLAGGTDGIGLALLRLILDKYWMEYSTVYILGRNFEQVDLLREESARLEHTAVVPLQCDITDSKLLEAKLTEIGGEVDEFINTIGTFYRGKAMDTLPETIQSHFNLNTVHNIGLTQLVVPKLKKGFSQILVCLASLAIAARQNYALQCATKAGYKLYLDAMRLELPEVRLMTIHPPSVNTNIFAKVICSCMTVGNCAVGVEYVVCVVRQAT